MNIKKRRCRHCGRLFNVCNKVKKHDYCKNEECQLARKSNWQKEKMKSDPAYREDQKSAQQDWCDNNPDYWKQYRKKNERYTDANREKQRYRNARRGKKAPQSPPQEPIAKMDALSKQKGVISGRYRLVPLEPQLIAKMDAIIVEIKSISAGYSNFGP
jgi:hypothetical protein